MPKKKKICVISGTRADYGILRPVLKEIKNSEKLDLMLIVTGMHLQKEFGNTYHQIENDLQKYIKVKAKDIGETISKFSKLFVQAKPDIVIVLGDRGEMLAAAIAANYLAIAVAHIHGGELSGHVDGVIRHAITKLSHLHFAATKKAKERIIKLGEERWRVIEVGAPGLDSIINANISDEKYLRKKYALDITKPLIIIVQHPVLAEAKESGAQIKETFKAILNYQNKKIQVIVIYPNSDIGNLDMIWEIEKYRKEKNIQIYKSLPHNDYLGLLKIAKVLVGNSSSGIIEAASFKLPVINIGTRQDYRERGVNVIDVGYNHKEISKALNKILERDKMFLKRLKQIKNPYGDGNASSRIVHTLEKMDFTKLLNKKMTY